MGNIFKRLWIALMLRCIINYAKNSPGNRRMKCPTPHRLSPVRIIASVALILLFGLSLPAKATEEAPSSCQKRLIRVLQRLSSDKHTVQLAPHLPSQMAASNRPQLVETSASVKIGSYDSRIPIHVGDFSEMEELLQRTKGKGFWILQNSSGPNQRLASSHNSVVVGDTWFNRLSDDLGEHALVSVNISSPPSELLQAPYIMGQFFELSEESAKVLHKFFHDRVWHYHAKTPEWHSIYNRHPTAREVSVERCENCTFFSWSFLLEDWLKVAPELEQIQNEIGAVSVTAIPSQQFFKNTQVRNFRQSFIWGPEKEKLLNSLKDGSFASDTEGHQSLLHSFQEN